MTGKIYRKAVELWGVDFQLNMVAEECCELAKAVLKLRRKVNGSSLFEVISEIADIEIMLEQLPFILEKMKLGEFVTHDIFRKDIESEKRAKMNRLKDMVKS